MGIVNYTYNRSTSGGEIITHLINATDGEGLHFDGADGYIDIATPPDLGTKFSFELIFKATTWTSGVIKTLVDFEGSGSNRFIIRTNASGNNLKIYDGTTDVDTGVVIFDDLTVHHVVVTIDGTAAVVYDNGNQVGSATISASHGLDNATDARIGSDIAGRRSNGTYYRTRFWNKTLSQAEVTASYENATVPFAEQWGVQTDAVTNGTFAADTNWSKESGWTISGGKAVCATTSFQALYQSGFTGGKKYRVTYTISDYSSGGIFLDSQGGAAVGVVPTDGTLRTANGTYTEEITINQAGNLLVFRGQLSTTTSLKLDDVSAYRVGVVADYDLAFANPTQSLMVQDRAGAADGTSSATGVVQVTPIEQLNSKSARIGTSVATPADGELMVSKVVAGATGLLGLYDNNVRSTGAGVLSVGTAGAGDIQFYRGDVNHTKLSATGLEVTGAVSATGIVKSTGTPGLSAATTSEAILASEGGYGAFIYGSGTTYDVTLGRRNTAVALGVLADTINLVAPGSLTVTGSLSKGSGSFCIPHPLPALADTHNLVHSFIEGPKADLIYRGRVELVAGKATVNIDTAATMTDGTFDVLCRDVQCFTTNETDWTCVRGKVAGNILTIDAEDITSTSLISWMVVGERKDKHIMEIEWTDIEGKVIVEPLRPDEVVAEPVAG